MRKLFTFLIVPLLAIFAVNAQTDVTNTYLLNPSFELASSVSTTIEHWTNLNNVFQSQNNTSFGKKDGSWYAEKWQNSGNLQNLKLSQHIASIPNGKYVLKAAAFTNNNYGGAFIFANDKKTEVFNTNDYSVIFEVTAGTLDYGFEVVKSSNWVACDNFRLYSLGTDPYLDVNVTSLNFNVARKVQTFFVKGANLTANATLTAPAGITLSKTSLTPAEVDAGIQVTATFDGTTTITEGAITITGGTASHSILVNTNAADAACYTPLYTDRPNIITDPLMYDLSTYAGWGTREIVTDTVYCGPSSLKISGRCGGSLDFNLNGKLKPNTLYRVKAMVSTNGTGEAKVGISGALAGSNVTKVFSTAFGEWIALDFTFTTQATLGNVNMYVNSCETQTATSIYIDNWEMYELFDAPTLGVSPATLLFDALNPLRVINVKGANLVSGLTLTAPAGIVLDKTTLTEEEAEAGAEVTAEYDFSTNIAGDSIVITGNMVNAKVIVEAVNTVEGCYNMLYDDKENLISDPLMNSLATYGGWGNKSIVSDGNAFCNNSGFINGTEVCYPNSGSIDAHITWKPFTTYRIYAMVRTDNGTMNIGVSNVGHTTNDLNFEVPFTNGVWQQFDQTFTTGATAGAGLCFFNGCGNSTGFIGYIDNWQIYELTDPALIVEPAALSFDPVHLVDSITVTGKYLTENITLTNLTGVTLDKTTITPAEAEVGAVVKVTYDLSSDIHGGKLTATSGTLTKDVEINASRYLINGSFERPLAGEWNNEGEFARANNGNFGLASGRWFMEKWMSSGSSLTTANLTQTILGLPNGNYTLKAVAKAVQQADNTHPGGAYIIAGASGVEVIEDADYSVTVDVVDESLIVGYQVVATGNWIAVDNFRLIQNSTSGLQNRHSLEGVNTFILNNRVHADVNLDKNSLTTITVYNVNGVKVAEKEAVLNAGTNRVVVDKELVRGVYLVEVKADGKFAAFKLVK